LISYACFVICYLFLLFFFLSLGLYIHRGCSMIETARHECDPPASQIDLDETLDFFCSQTCSTDGCNQHAVEEITLTSSAYSPANRHSYAFLISLFIILLQ